MPRIGRYPCLTVEFHRELPPGATSQVLGLPSEDRASSHGVLWLPAGPYVDLSLGPSDRDYGSLSAHRPDLFNSGPFGFARMVTPEAWLSTWSGLAEEESRNAAVATIVASLREKGF